MHKTIPTRSLSELIGPETLLRNKKGLTLMVGEKNKRQMLEEQINVCKEAGVKEVSYIIRAGDNPTE